MVMCLIMQHHSMCLNAVIISYTIHSNSLEKEMTSLYGIRQPAEFTKARHWISSRDTNKQHCGPRS